MIRLPRPSRLNTETFRDELGADGLDSSTVFYTEGDEIVFDLPADLKDRITALLGRHKGVAKPVPPTPAETRLASLESWAMGINSWTTQADEAMNQLILDALFASMSDEDILADLGGL